MRDEMTLEAMANAKLAKLSSPGESFKRYEIQFPDGIIPEELKIVAQGTEKAREVGSQIVTVPDEAIVAHLKVYDKEQADISLTVFTPDKGALYMLDVPLHPAELRMFEKELQSHAKKPKFDRTDD